MPAWRFSKPLVLVALLAFIAQPALVPSSIQGSAHDFSGVDADEQLCIFCHTAHNSDETVADAPLWNHAVTNRTYKTYNSPSMDATTTAPSGESRLCLSCHDGTVAVDSYGGRSGVIFVGGDLAVGADDLTNDHPVSFVYDDALASDDGELHAPSDSSGLGASIADDLLSNDRLECSSCHDVHNGEAAEAVNDHLLVITQAQSQLCLTCHIK